MHWRNLVLLVGCTSLVTCAVELEAPLDAQVSCSKDAHCSNGRVCLPSLGRCEKPEADCVRAMDVGFDIVEDGVPCGGDSGRICLHGECLEPECGDGVTTGNEECDLGAANSQESDAACRTDCTAMRCGDSVIDTSEACDDGNAIDGDGCDTNCTLTSCGNDIQDETEECDDGNIVDGDGCDGNCTTTRCGNGVTTGLEQCDDGNAVTEDCVYGERTCVVCGESCQVVVGEPLFCGNGTIEPAGGEWCDDGNVTNDDGCNQNCEVEDSRTQCEGEPSYCAVVIYVDRDAAGNDDGTSWENAFTSLVDALADAEARGGRQDIWVAEGIYHPDEGSGVADGDRTSSFWLVADVRVYGGFSGTESDRSGRNLEEHPAILDGDLNDDDDANPTTWLDNAFSVVTVMGASGVLLDGLTIRGGNADGVAGNDPIEDRAGGGAFLSSSQVVVNGCVLENNRASEVGGAISSQFSDLVVKNCTFTGNSSDDTGGAIDGLVGTLAISDSSFSDNTTAMGGAAVKVEGTPSVIASTTFAQNSSSARAGAIYVVVAPVELRDVVFTNNDGGDGGAFGAGRARIDVTDCRFQGNAATGDGGAIDLHEVSGAVTSSRFVANQAASGLGGAIYLAGGEIEVVRAGFWGNSATYGGGLLVAGNASISDSLLSGNTATADGGGVYAIMFPARIVGSTLASNSAENGGGVYASSSVDVVNSILWGNSASIADPNAGGATIVDHSCVGGLIVAGNLACCGDESCAPGFSDADGADDVAGTEDDSMVVPSGSVCVDSGNNDAVSSLTTADFAGNPRVVDDPSTPDTGNGSAPIVDIGAYELQP